MPDTASPACVVEDVPFSWLAEHEKELAVLLAAQQEPTPFQTPPWLASWWEAYGQGCEAHILVIRRRGEIAGLMPLMVKRGKIFTVIEWLGSGRSDHCPLLLSPDSTDECLEQAISFLRRSAIGWSLLSLRTLQEAQCGRLTGRLPPECYRVDRDDVSPRTAIRGSWEEYLGQKSKKHRGNIKRLLKQARETPRLDVSCAREFSPALLDEIIEVERHSWKAREGSLRLEGRGRVFYESFLAKFSGQGQLELWLCRYDGLLLAYIITFRYQDIIFYYNGAYRSDYASFHADISPGSLLIACAVKDAHERGLKAFDFLRGDEPYKKLWINEDRRLYHVVVRARGWRGWLAEFLLIRLRWWLRRYPLAQTLHDRLQRLRGASS